MAGIEFRRQRQAVGATACKLEETEEMGEEIQEKLDELEELRDSIIGREEQK